MKQFTKEQETISSRNKAKARAWFREHGLIPSDGKRYALHHKDPSWRQNDIERYIQWNVEDLEVMSLKDHAKWHYEHSDNFGFKEGHEVPEEMRQKMSEAHSALKDNYSYHHRMMMSVNHAGGKGDNDTNLTYEEKVARFEANEVIKEHKKYIRAKKIEYYEWLKTVEEEINSINIQRETLEALLECQTNCHIRVELRNEIKKTIADKQKCNKQKRMSFKAWLIENE